jgi:hypothetical protein
MDVRNLQAVSTRSDAGTFARRGVAVGLVVVAVLAGWLSLSLLLALLGQPAETLTTLHERGARGVPAVVWSGSRDLVSWLRAATDLLRHD